MRVNGGAERLIGTTGDDFYFPYYVQRGLDQDADADWMEIRVEFRGASSGYSPILYKNVPPKNDFYSWELHYVYIPDTVTTEDIYEFHPTENSYRYSKVELNTASGIVNGNGEYVSDFKDTIALDQGGAALNSFSQTFVATHNRIVGAKAHATSNPGQTVQYRATIHEGGPSGPQIGGEAVSPIYLALEYPKIAVYWPMRGPNSVPVVPGETYALTITKVPAGMTDVFSLYTSGKRDSYENGELYRDGSPLPISEDMVGMVIAIDALPRNGTMTPTIPPPSTGVETGWKAYY